MLGFGELCQGLLQGVHQGKAPGDRENAFLEDLLGSHSRKSHLPGTLGCYLGHALGVGMEVGGSSCQFTAPAGPLSPRNGGQGSNVWSCLAKFSAFDSPVNIPVFPFVRSDCSLQSNRAYLIQNNSHD